jgi:hypothetical protein
MESSPTLTDDFGIKFYIRASNIGAVILMKKMKGVIKKFKIDIMEERNLPSIIRNGDPYRRS